MQYIKKGSGDKKILIIHGWMHSAKRYFKLADELSSRAEITLFEFPGFGDAPKIKKLNVLEYYVDILYEFLETHEFDLIITHSLGSNILLKTLSKRKTIYSGKIIFSNPAYFGIDHIKPIALLVPINIMLLYLQKKLPLKVALPFIKIFALFSINKIKLIDEIIINDSRKADPVTAAIVLYQLAFDKWRIRNNCINNALIIMSSKDRIISSKKVDLLSQDINDASVITIQGVGHTLVLEKYSEFLNIIEVFMKE